MTPRRLYRILSIAEAITWSLLIAALIARYGFGLDQFVFPAGFTHGFVFLSYGATVIVVGLNQRWPLGRIAFGVLTAVIPFATIPFDRWLERRHHLDGAWRRDATDDPRDASVIDRMLRWFLRHPWILIGGAVVAIAALFAVLLALGPPTEWGS